MIEGMTATPQPTPGQPGQQHQRFIAPLVDGPVDVVGDVHGEIEALERLLCELGYDPTGNHPAARSLVFVGDLCDRGPDSVAVIRRVAALVQRGRAQCVLGNHELNLLRGAAKEGNGWMMEVDHDRAAGKFDSSRRATPAERHDILQFFARLPLALERPDLRVVHACWDAAAVATMRVADDPDVANAYARFRQQTNSWLSAHGTLENRRRERERFRAELVDPQAQVPFLPAIAEYDERQQMGSPVRILTAGIERQARVPFYASGKWRMVERVRWWDEYTDDVPVIFGHYWRTPLPHAAPRSGGMAADLFAGTRPEQWLGARHNAFCADFSIGRRYLERERGVVPGTATRLGAVRWPERILRFEDGERFELR